MDVEGLYWNKINVLIDIVLIGGVGGGREGNTESFIVSLDVNKPTLPWMGIQNGRFS